MKSLLKYRILIIVGLIGLSVLLGTQMKHITRDAGVSSLLPEDHPDYLYWKEMENIFGATDQIVVGIAAKDSIYTLNSIKLIDELTVFFEDLDEIDEDDVTSLTNVDDMEGLEGELLIDPLIENEDIASFDETDLQRIREKVRSNPLFYERLISADERKAVIIAGTPTDVSMEDKQIAALKEKVVKKVDEVREKYPEVTINLSGTPILKAVVSEYMRKDMGQLFPCAILIVMLALFFLLRSMYGMAIPILVTVFSVIWAFGLKGFLNSPLTIVETMIPIMLIAIGCADGVHIISEFFGFFRKGYPVREALSATMRILTLPVILTSVTTGLGFLSLLSAPGVSIKNMGLFLAFGVMVAMLFSLLFIPALTSFYRKNPKKDKQTCSRKTHRSSSRFHNMVQKVAAGIVKHRIAVASASVIFLGMSVLGVIHIRVEADEVKYFKPENPFRIATERIQEDLGGVTSLDIIVEGNGVDTMKQPRILDAIWKLQKFCEQQELVSYSVSVVDFVKRINYVLHDSDPAFDRIPNEVETVHYEEYEDVNGAETLVEKMAEVSGFNQVAQFLLLYEMGGGDATDEYVDDEYQLARINVRLKDMSSQRLTGLLNAIRPYLAEHFPKDVNVRFSNHYIRFVMQTLIIDSQIYSLLTVLAAILILMSIIFRSVIVGLITSLPVFLAVLLNFAVMWIFGVTLDIGTSIIASVGMGVGIDYAIHYFTRFRLLLKEGKAYDSAIISAITDTSRAILSNAFAVGLGFLVLLFSEYQVIANIGWITALSMFTTAFSSLTVLPAILSIVKPKIRWSKSKSKTTGQLQTTSLSEQRTTS